MTHRNITLTEEERTAAFVGYLFVCLAWACREPSDNDWFYAWITKRAYRGGGTFGGAVCWAMRMQDERTPDAATDPEEWLSYVEHVVGYRCAAGNGHDALVMSDPSGREA